MPYRRIKSRSSVEVRQDYKDSRIKIMAIAFTLLAIFVIARLFGLMVLQHSFYTALAAGAQDVYSQLFPKRGSILIQDSRTLQEYPLAMNRDFFLVFADTREIKTDDEAEHIAGELATVFNYNDEQKLSLYLNLNKRTDPYEPIEKKVSEEVVSLIKEKNLLGIGFVRRPERVYPEGSLAAQLLGFVGKNEEGGSVGRYGIEGYWQEELAGEGGFITGARGAAGGLIPLAGGVFSGAVDGSNILLTIDRALQFKACDILQKKADEYEATSASLVILEPSTGAIRVMCGFPDFDPNIYNEVESVDVYNNKNIFTPYEPGSIFKPITMAAAINEDLVTPETPFVDSGSVEAGCSKVIKNANEKAYGRTNMIGVLENSINTGMVFVVQKLGKDKFKSYVERFGFGIKEGIELDTEVSGTINSLSKNKGDKIDCYAATGAFGQGLTATPLQMASAFGVIANGGLLMKPFIVQEIRHSNGKVERTKPTEVGRVIEARAASLVSGMMVNVVDSGQAAAAAVPGYYVAGKTGTAQISGVGGYSEDTNHSFVGFAPVDDPKFVMIVKFEKPQRKFSVSTAAPTFGEIAKFVLEYYQVVPIR